MKSPQFSTWSPSQESTKGGSVIAYFGSGNGNRPLSYQRDPGGFLVKRELAGASFMTVVPAGPAKAESGGLEQGLQPIPAWKRIFDLTFLLLSLPATLPLGLVIVAWVKIVSPGPVFFRQERIGRGGRVFKILKFRSMKADTPTSTHEQHMKRLICSNAPMTKLDGAEDPRIIPGGRCLRAIGLDELPQLINVLRGEMSLVGPRPSTPLEFELFTNEQKSRVSALPGLTGYWQVSGKNKLTFQQMIDLDLKYITKMTFGMDLAIVAATLPAMLLQYMESRSLKSQAGPLAGTAAAPSPVQPSAVRTA